MAKAIEIVYKGKDFESFSAFADFVNIPRTTLNRYRLLGHSIEECVTLCKDKPKKYTCNGKEYTTLKEVAKDYNLNAHNISTRLGKGMSLEEAVVCPIQDCATPVLFNNKSYPSIRNFAETFGADYYLVYHRIKLGWSLEDALTVPADTTMGAKKSVVYNGVPYESYSDLCKDLNIVYERFLHRLSSGMSVEDAILTPVRRKKRIKRDLTYKDYNYETLSEICSEFNINISTLRGRLGYNWSLAKAVETPIRK